MRKFNRAISEVRNLCFSSVLFLFCMGVMACIADAEGLTSDESEMAELVSASAAEPAVESEGVVLPTENDDLASVVDNENGEEALVALANSLGAANSASQGMCDLTFRVAHWNVAGDWVKSINNTFPPNNVYWTDKQHGRERREYMLDQLQNVTNIEHPSKNKLKREQASIYGLTEIVGDKQAVEIYAKYQNPTRPNNLSSLTAEAEYLRSRLSYAGHPYQLVKVSDAIRAGTAVFAQPKETARNLNGGVQAILYDASVWKLKKVAAFEITPVIRYALMAQLTHQCSGQTINFVEMHYWPPTAAHGSFINEARWKDLMKFFDAHSNGHPIVLAGDMNWTISPNASYAPWAREGFETQIAKSGYSSVRKNAKAKYASFNFNQDVGKWTGGTVDYVAVKGNLLQLEYRHIYGREAGLGPKWETVYRSDHDFLSAQFAFPSRP